MEAINKPERRTAFGKFLAMYLLSIVLVVIAMAGFLGAGNAQQSELAQKNDLLTRESEKLQDEIGHLSHDIDSINTWLMQSNVLHDDYRDLISDGEEGKARRRMRRHTEVMDKLNRLRRDFDDEDYLGKLPGLTKALDRHIKGLVDALELRIETAGDLNRELRQNENEENTDQAEAAVDQMADMMAQNEKAALEDDIEVLEDEVDIIAGKLAAAQGEIGLLKSELIADLDKVKEGKYSMFSKKMKMEAALDNMKVRYEGKLDIIKNKLNHP
jgi:chromosome segregation ATPase